MALEAPEGDDGGVTGVGARTQKARDKRCPGCRGIGGKHMDPHCRYLLDEVSRIEAKMARESRKGRR